VEEGYIISALALQEVECDEEGTPCLEYNWATVPLGEINTQTWSSRLGVGRRAGDLVL
jgi:hypothetical protein